MSTPGPMREVLDDVRTELRLRRAQVLAGLTYVSVAAGGLYLLSSLGKDSAMHWDSMDRSTVASIGIALLVLGCVLGGVTLMVDRAVRHTERSTSGRPVPLRSRVGVVIAMVIAAALTTVGVVAVLGWS
jgi:heme/copper-type cytochrome/quinol oxidase subunit 2